MPYAMSGQCRIYYESHGSGPPLVLVHGAGGNHAIWWQQVAHFRARHRVITVDLRGFGRSDTVSDGPDSLDFPEDIHAVLQHAEAAPAVLLGQSIGAVAALRCAVRHPERVAAVVLANSVGGLSHPELTPLVKADRAEAEKLAVIDRLLTKPFQEQQAAKTLLFLEIGTFNQAKMPDLRNMSTPGPTPDEVRRSGVKVHFIAGETDRVLSPPTARKAQSLLTSSTLDVVAGAPHSMYWEVPELFNTSLEGCLHPSHGAA
jgi:pimeloyl-ACP methyl ester carboxylesterase